MIMKKSELKQIIRECIQEKALRESIRKCVLEVIQEGGFDFDDDRPSRRELDADAALDAFRDEHGRDPDEDDERSHELSSTEDAISKHWNYGV